MGAKRALIFRTLLALCIYASLLFFSALLAIGLGLWTEDEGELLALMALLNLPAILSYWLMQVVGMGMLSQPRSHQGGASMHMFRACLTTKDVFRMINQKITRELVEKTEKKVKGRPE